MLCSGITPAIPIAIKIAAPTERSWPSMSDNTWAAGVHKFYGTPYSTV